MTFLCLELQTDSTVIAYQVADYAQCIGFIVVDPVTYSNSLIQGLSYAESGQLIGATALLFSVAFILRFVRKHIGF